MLYNPSDYKFVDTSNASNWIHGNIIPVLFPDAYADAILYYENYLFMLEAWHERRNVEDAGNNDITIPRQTLVGGNIYALRNSTSNLYNGTIINGPYLHQEYSTYYINKNTVVPSSDVRIGSLNQINLGDYLQNYSLAAAEGRLPYSRLSPLNSSASSRYYSVLYSEFMRAKFWTFDNMRKLLIPLYFDALATSMTTTYYDEYGQIESQNPINLGTSSVSYQGYAYKIHGTGYYLRYKASAVYKNSFFIMPYAKSAKLVFSGNVFNAGEDTYTNGAYIWTYMDLTVAPGGVITVPNDCLQVMADKLITLGSKNQANVNISMPDLIVDFEFPARLDGVNWNWQPQYTS